MKKIIALAIGLGLMLGTVSFAAPQDKTDKPAKKGKKKKSTDSTDKKM